MIKNYKKLGHEKHRVAILGLGSFGTAIAKLLCENDHEVCVWTRSHEKADCISQSRINTEYLPDVYLPDSIFITHDMEKALFESDIAVIAVPSRAVRETIKLAAPFLLSKQVIVSASKGLETNTLLRLSEVITQCAPMCKIAVLSGPCHAEEIARNLPTTCVVASNDQVVAEYVQDIFFSPNFRVYTNSDIIGVELGGALKNVIALAAGICDGIGFGDNAKAALMTRGIAEIACLGVAMGANKLTYSGLTGIGDLIVTCTSIHSRNRRAGILLGEGRSLEETLNKIHMVVEGVETTKAAFALSLKYQVEMPITKEINNALYQGKSIHQAVADLMRRDKKDEILQNADHNRGREELYDGLQF